MPRPSIYSERVDIEPLRGLYGTPKHAYALLNLRKHVPWVEFYRVWSMGVGRPATAALILAAHRAWCANAVLSGDETVDPDRTDFALSDREVELLAYANR